MLYLFYGTNNVKNNRWTNEPATIKICMSISVDLMHSFSNNEYRQIIILEAIRIILLMMLIIIIIIINRIGNINKFNRYRCYLHIKKTYYTGDEGTQWKTACRTCNQDVWTTETDIEDTWGQKFWTRAEVCWSMYILSWRSWILNSLLKILQLLLILLTVLCMQLIFAY